MFDQERFCNTEFHPREEDFPAPQLSEFFGPDQESAFRVRGLTARELASCEDAARRERAITVTLESLSSDSATSRAIKEAKDALGVGNKQHPDVSKRIEVFLLGCIQPAGLNRRTVVAIADRFPLLFFEITNKIQVLTGLGFDSKKPTPSGETTG